MNLNTRYFGTIEVDTDKEIVFKEGIPGFESLTRFIIVEEEESGLNYLQSIEDGDIAFTIVNPYEIDVDYNPSISEAYFDKLGGGYSCEFCLYCIVTANEDLLSSTVNLKAPLLIHSDRRLGVQVIADNSEYSIKQNIGELIGGSK